MLTILIGVAGGAALLLGLAAAFLAVRAGWAAPTPARALRALLAEPLPLRGLSLHERMEMVARLWVL